MIREVRVESAHYRKRRHSLGYLMDAMHSHARLGQKSDCGLAGHIPPAHVLPVRV